MKIVLSNYDVFLLKKVLKYPATVLLGALELVFFLSVMLNRGLKSKLFINFCTQCWLNFI